MSSINLKKKDVVALQADMGVVMATMRLFDIKANVALMIDDSGSMSEEYEEDHVQLAVDRVLPIGMTWDPDKKIDIFSINNGYLGTVDVATVHGWVKKNLGPTGGTDCANVVRTILKHFKTPINKPVCVPTPPVVEPYVYAVAATLTKPKTFWDKVKDFFGFGSKPETSLYKAAQATPPPPSSIPGHAEYWDAVQQQQAQKSIPTIVIFITDGEVTDRRLTTPLLLSSTASASIFFMFVGIGNRTTFQYLKDLPKQGLTNSAFFQLPCEEEQEPMDDQTLYKELTGPFSKWLKANGYGT